MNLERIKAEVIQHTNARYEAAVKADISYMIDNIVRNQLVIKDAQQSIADTQKRLREYKVQEEVKADILG